MHTNGCNMATNKRKAKPKVGRPKKVNKLEHANLVKMIKAKEKSIEVREAACDRELAQGMAGLAKQQAQIAKLKAEFDAEIAKRDAEIAKRDAEIAERDTEFAKQQAEFVKQKAELAALQAEAAKSVQATLVDREAAVEEREKVLRSRSLNAEAERNTLQHRRGELLTEAQSRCILLHYFDLQQRGCGENESVRQAARVLRVGENKVRDVSVIAAHDVLYSLRF